MKFWENCSRKDYYEKFVKTINVHGNEFTELLVGNDADITPRTVKFVYDVPGEKRMLIGYICDDIFTVSETTEVTGKLLAINNHNFESTSGTVRPLKSSQQRVFGVTSNRGAGLYLTAFSAKKECGWETVWRQ